MATSRIASSHSGGADHDRFDPPAIAGRAELRVASRLAALGGWRSNPASVDPRVCAQCRARVSRVSMAGAVLRAGRDADGSPSGACRADGPDPCARLDRARRARHLRHAGYRVGPLCLEYMGAGCRGCAAAALPVEPLAVADRPVEHLACDRTRLHLFGVPHNWPVRYAGITVAERRDTRRTAS